MKIKPYLSLLILLGVLLAACAPQAGAPQTEAPQAEAPQAEAPQTEAPQAGEVEQTLYIGPQLVDCAGVAPQKCLQVKDSPDGEYRLFYDQIEGFEFEEGNEYVLSVRVETIENPPADSSNMQYRLVEVISSMPSSAPPGDSGSIPSGPVGKDLEGQVWSLISYLNAANAMAESVSGSQVTAQFKEGQIFGNAGCNNYSASYQVDGSSIQIGQAASTLMFCSEPEGVMDQEAAFLKALSLAASYKISGGQLQLSDASGNIILVFGQAQPASLTGVVWQMTMFNNGQSAVVSALEGVQVTAIFEEDFSLNGSAGCNRYTASYQQEGDSLTIGPVASTFMSCPEPEGVMEQEAAYLQALASTATFELQGDRLTLRAASGEIAVEYSLFESVGLLDTSWLLSLYYVGGDAVTSPLAGTEITANFMEGGKLSGSAGCNNYNAGYELDGSSLIIGPVASTRMACPEPPGMMEQEAAFLALLEQTASYRINVDTLILMDANGTPLAEFTASPLVGVTWKWQQFQSNDDSVQAPVDPDQYTLEFMTDGTVAIQADCNRAIGTYTLDGSLLDIEIGPVTLAFCPEGSLSEEYLRLLGDVVAYVFEGNDLFLDVKFDSGTMRFSR